MRGNVILLPMVVETPAMSVRSPILNKSKTNDPSKKPFACSSVFEVCSILKF